MTVSSLHGPCPGRAARPAIANRSARGERGLSRALLAGLALVLLLGVPALMAPAPPEGAAKAALKWHGNAGSIR